MPNGEIVVRKVAEKSPVSLDRVANKVSFDPAVEFAGNTQFVTLNPARFFKPKR
jgi:hypothetical protein